MTCPSVALLAEGDNMGSGFAGQVFRLASELGPLRIGRAWCNAINGWNDAPGYQVLVCGQARNAAGGKVSEGDPSAFDRKVGNAPRDADSRGEGIAIARPNGLTRRHRPKIGDEPERKWRPCVAARPQPCEIIGDARDRVRITLAPSSAPEISRG